MNDQELTNLIEQQRNLMISVATNGPSVKSTNNDYVGRRNLIQDELIQRSVPDPNPHIDLWDWHGKWTSGDLPSYQSRRQYISNIYGPLIEQLRNRQIGGNARITEPTGWHRVDRTVTEIRRRLAEARTEEQFQAVGLLCREALISLASSVYDPNVHQTLDGVTPSDTDGKRMLEAYVNSALSGGSNEIARRHAKASLDLANELQHRRTASFQGAALCVEASTSVVNIIAIISGQRDPR